MIKIKKFKENKRTLQSIIIKKSDKVKGKNDAETIAKKYGKIYTSRETSTSFRFRQRDDDDFKKGTFRTAVINPQVSLVYGELK